VAEAAFAAALGLRLGVANSYGDVVEDRPILGSGRPPGPHDIAAAVDLSRDVTMAAGGPARLRRDGRCDAALAGVGHVGDHDRS
jgi:adenosylcobinamide-phosphate synthase